MGNAQCTVSNQTQKPISVLTFNMTDMLTKFYKTLYIVEPGESMVVEANADAVGLRLGIVYDALDNRDILFYRFSCNNGSTLTITSVDTKVIQHYGDNTTQNSNGKLSNFSATPFQLIVNTLNAEVRTRSASQAPPPSSPSNPRADFIKQRKNSVISSGSFDESSADGTATTSQAPEDLPAVYLADLPEGSSVSVPVSTILEASGTLAGISQVILTNNALRADQAFPASLFEDFLVLNATLTSVAAFYKTCVVHTGTQVSTVDLIYFTELINDATQFSSDSTRDINILKKRYRYLFSALTIKTINKKLIDELLLPLTVRAATNVSIHLKESEEQTRSVIGRLAASMDQVILDMCSESMRRLKADSSSPSQMFRKRSMTRDVPEQPSEDPVLVSLQSRVGHACEALVDGAPCSKCQDFGFDILAKFTPLSPQSTKCSYCSCDVSCHSGPKVDKAYVEARQAREEAEFAAQPHSALGAQRRQSLLHASPEKVDPAADLQRSVGRKCTNIVDGAPCDKCAGYGFEIQPRFTPLSPQSTRCGLCSCDVSCHDGPVEARSD